MTPRPSAPHDPLSILHVLRAPTGGLFRHVNDLARAQTDAGHKVGIVADTLTGGETATQDLAELDTLLAHGVTRTPIPRAAGWRDLTALAHTKRRVRQTDAAIVHGHGAKGGLFARLAARASKRTSAYTPHGGSLNFDPRTAAGRVYHGVERALIGSTGAVVFESAYAQGLYTRLVGPPPPASRVVVNGLAEADFADIPLAPDAADFTFIGELRPVKGVDIALRALAGLEGARFAIIGDGPSEAGLRALTDELGLDDRVVFHGRNTPAYAFAQGRCVLVPSHTESMPYVVLEALAAARPIIATRVGGIPEILDAADLVPANDVDALRAAMAGVLNDADAQSAAKTRRDDVRSRFSAARMAGEIEAAYRSAIAGGALR